MNNFNLCLQHKVTANATHLYFVEFQRYMEVFKMDTKNLNIYQDQGYQIWGPELKYIRFACLQ